MNGDCVFWLRFAEANRAVSNLTSTEVTKLMDTPENCKYCKEHTWALVENGDVVLVGITDFAQEELGEIIFVELPKVGAAVKAGQPMGQIESLKSISDLFPPVTGEVIEVNQEAMQSPDIVNSDPHGKGWLVRLRCSAPDELDGLLDANGYRALTS